VDQTENQAKEEVPRKIGRISCYTQARETIKNLK